MTPLQELQDAIRQFAEKTGFPEPISAVLEMPDGLPSVPIPAKAAAGLPNRQTRKEAIVLQAILSAEEPITLKELIRVTRRSRTFDRNTDRSRELDDRRHSRVGRLEELVDALAGDLG